MLLSTLFLLFFIFGGIGLLVWVAVRYSNKRWYGKNSPLKVAHTFQISAWQYFTRPNFIFLILTHLCFYALLIWMFRTLPIQPDLVWGYFLIFGAIILLFGYLGYKDILLQLHFWEHTKNKKIITIPEEKALLICEEGRQLRLQKGDIEALYAVGTFNSKGIANAYYLYYLKNGSSFVLTEPMPGRWVLEDYLGYVEPQVIEQRWPKIDHQPVSSVADH